MNKKIFTAIITTILVFSSLKAFAVVIPEEKIKQEISKQIIHKYRNYTNGEIEVNVVATPYSSITVPDGKVTYKVFLNSDKFLPRDLVKVAILVNGRVRQSFNAPIVVKIYDYVFVAASSIEREKPINASDVLLEKKEVSNNFSHVLREDSLYKERYAKKYFSKGEIIDDRYVKLKPDVLRNSVVTVLFNTNNLTVSVDGVAMSDGVIGEIITVLNKDYNKVYKGTVIGENRILVKIWWNYLKTV